MLLDNLRSTRVSGRARSGPHDRIRKGEGKRKETKVTETLLDKKKKKMKCFGEFTNKHFVLTFYMGRQSGGPLDVQCETYPHLTK